MFTKLISVPLFIAITATIVVPIYSVSILTGELNDEWESFKLTYQKSYENKFNEAARRLIWEDNVKYINRHNMRYNLGKETYFMGINKFSDWTDDELKKMRSPFDLEGFWSNNVDTEMFIESLNGTLPIAVNWTARGYVTPVKNQKYCGSCYAFGATGAMEGQYKRKTGKLVSFSEQQIVDCSSAFGNGGCDGGLIHDCFSYIKKYGLEEEESYPYKAKEGKCKYQRSLTVGHCSGFVRIQRCNESALMAAVAQIGPIAVGINVSSKKFIRYQGGIFNDPTCNQQNLDHAVLVVGYGEVNGTPYWLVKNSWGSEWGENGYILMSKDRNNQCGIASAASYPRV